MASVNCGASDKRNEEFTRSFSSKQYFTNLIGVKNDAPTILDIGAHRGESIDFFKEIFPNSSIYSFEPDPDNFKELKRKHKDTNNVSLFNSAISDRDCTLEYYKQSLSHLGGCLEIDNHSLDSIGYAKTADNNMIQVAGRRLDSILKETAVDRIDLLKIDVQGYELNVLKGGPETLSRTQAIIVEIGFFDFYKNSSTLADVVQELNQIGFAPWDISKVSKNPKTLGTDWADFAFKKQSQ